MQEQANKPSLISLTCTSCPLASPAYTASRVWGCCSTQASFFSKFLVWTRAFTVNLPMFLFALLAELDHASQGKFPLPMTSFSYITSSAAPDVLALFCSPSIRQIHSNVSSCVLPIRPSTTTTAIATQTRKHHCADS